MIAPPRTIHRLAAALAVAALPWAPARAQIRDQILVYAITDDFDFLVHRYDRRMNLLGASSLAGLANSLTLTNHAVVAADGTYSIALDALDNKLLIRIGPDGNIVKVVAMSHNPIAAAADRLGFVYVLTRIPLNFPGPILAYDAAGNLVWSNATTTQTNFTAMPQTIAVTSAGQIWIGGGAQKGPGGPSAPYLVEVDPADGSAKAAAFLRPPPGVPMSFFTDAHHIFPGREGALWTITSALSFHQTLGTTHVKGFNLLAGNNGSTVQSWVDKNGDIWTPAINDAPYWSTAIQKFSGRDGSLLQVIETDLIVSMAPGPTGEEIFLITNHGSVFGQRCLRRINLVTLVQSAVPMAGELYDLAIPFGDPTGWRFANVADRDGDNDQDGVPNGVETDAGTNPFDPLSRPDGPKVYLWFLDGSNAIALRFIEPDGLFHPTRGLDLATVKLLAGGLGDVLPAMWPFLSKISISPDQTEATLEFGDLPIPENLGLRLEVQASDKKGFSAYDWQITPPGVALAP